MMARVEFVPAEDWHIVAIAADMRADDVMELNALGKHDIERALEDALRRSRMSACCMINGQPAALLGMGHVGSVLTPIGVPWMLGSTLLDTHRRVLLTEALPMVDYMRSKYPRMENYVYAGSKKSVRWLRRLGFEIHRPIPLGPDGQEFHPFTMG